MREFKYGVGVIAPNFLLNLLLVKMSEKSSTKADFRGKNQKDMSDNGTMMKIGGYHFWLIFILTLFAFIYDVKSFSKFLLNCPKN